LHAGFTKAMVDESREKLKISAVQTRTVYEILRLMVSTNAEEIRNYRLDVKKRLYKPYARSAKERRRIERAGLVPEETEHVILNGDAIKDQLAKSYDALVQRYQAVIDRLNQLPPGSLPTVARLS